MIAPQRRRRGARRVADLPRRRALEPQRVEEDVVRLAHAERAELALERAAKRVHAPRDGRQPVRAVIDGVEAGDVGQQRLRRADVRRRLLAADVLLARLERHAIRRVAVRVHRHADDAARRLPHVLLARREERRVRTAVAQRHAEALRVADHDVRAQLAGRA